MSSALVRWSRETVADRISLVCFGWAGAGAAPFRTWAAALPEVVVHAVRLPARESRLDEDPVDEMGPLVEELAMAVGEVVDSPYALLGICLGAHVAFEVARELRRRQAPAPVRLFVGSQVAPCYRTGAHTAEAEDVRTYLVSRDLPSPEILAHEEFFRVLEQAVAADLRLGARYRYVADDPLSTPITAFVGLQDRAIDQDRVCNWALETDKEFDLHTLDGNEVFAGDAWGGVAAFVGARLRGDRERATASH